MALPIGALISGGASILGGLLGKSSADKQMAMQKTFAKNAIQWKTADALKAGVHPAFALGAPTISYNPVQVGQLGEGLAQAGQDIGRAMTAQMPGDMKGSVYSKGIAALELERGGLQNEILKEQLRQMRAPGTPPAYPGGNAVIPGQGDTRVFDIFGKRVTTPAHESSANTLENEYGEGADVVGGIRLLRDTDDIQKEWLGKALRAIISGQGPGIIAPDFGFGRRRNYSRNRYGG